MSNNEILKQKLKQHELIPALYTNVFKEIITCTQCREYTCSLLSEITGINYNFLLDNLKIIDENETNTELKDTCYADLTIKNLTLLLRVNNTHKPKLKLQNNFYKKNYISKRLFYDSNQSKKIDTYEIIFDIHDLYKKTFSEFKFMEKDTGETENESYIKYHINLFKILNKYYHHKKLDYKEKLVVVLALDSKYELLEICNNDEIINTVFDKLKMLKTSELIKEIISDKYQEKVIEIEKEYEQIEANKVGRIYVAKNMLIDKLDIKIISKYTNISIEDLKKIRTSL